VANSESLPFRLRIEHTRKPFAVSTGCNFSDRESFYYNAPGWRASDCGNTLCGQGGQLLTAELPVLDTRKKILTAKIAKKRRKGREENQL
jgi:hypothetical protein